MPRRPDFTRRSGHSSQRGNRLGPAIPCRMVRTCGP